MGPHHIKWRRESEATSLGVTLGTVVQAIARNS